MKKLREKLLWLPFTIGYKRGPVLVSKLRRWWVIARNPHANIRIHPTCYLGPGFSLHITGGGTFEAGPYCQFRRNFRAELEGFAHIRFGQKCICTYDVLMQCTTSIWCGDEVMLGQSCFLADGSHNFRDVSKPMLSQGYAYQPLRLDDGAAVTSKCTILADLGKRVWIGANAVVTRPVPDYCLAVGVPAKVIDYFGPPGGEPPELRSKSASSS
jgi:acetyltransferase-like isoleucine patch superfamily enzyme